MTWYATENDMTCGAVSDMTWYQTSIFTLQCVVICSIQKKNRVPDKGETQNIQNYPQLCFALCHWRMFIVIIIIRHAWSSNGKYPFSLREWNLQEICKMKTTWPGPAGPVWFERQNIAKPYAKPLSYLFLSEKKTNCDLGKNLFQFVRQIFEAKVTIMIGPN